MLFPREHLVAALHWRDICYLAPTPQGDEPHLTDEELIVGLAGSRDGRLRFALAGLLLRHPQIGAAARHLVAERKIDLRGITTRHDDAPNVPDDVWDEVRRQYVAATYLQRLWRTRLKLALGDSPLIPEAFTRELNLPSPDAMHGEQGLRTLTDESVFNDWSSYQQVIDMICEQPCRAEVPRSEARVDLIGGLTLDTGLGTRDSEH